MTAEAKRPEPGVLGLALDFGPLLVFFLGYQVFGLIIGTGAFMAAIAVAVIVSKWRLGRVSPMLWLSALLVIGFGALTIWFADERFIQIKPTIIYAMFCALLFGGLLFGKPLLKPLLGAAFEGLSDTGWIKLSRNWGLFFFAMALVNEAMRATLPFSTWLTLKVWGVTTLSLIFGAANIPMMIRHGLKLGDDEAAEAKPPEG